jgi:hypothetical protein
VSWQTELIVFIFYFPAVMLGGPLTWSVIDAFVMLGVAVILPLAMPSRRWPLAAIGVYVALPFLAGYVLAAVFALPWVGVAVWLLAGEVRELRVDRLTLTLDRVAGVVAAGFGVVAAVHLFESRAGWELFGVREPIVELTAVHFTFAGVGALTLARRNLLATPGRWAQAAVVLTMVAPPLVALGFVSRLAVPQVGGAVLMTAAAWATGSLHLRAAWRSTRPVAGRVLLAVSGISVWAPMVLALAWAAAQHWDVPAMSISDMARVHGTLNGLGFTLCGLLAWRVGERQKHASSGDPHPSAVAVRAAGAAA